MEEAIFLTRFATRVILVHRREEFPRRRSCSSARTATPRSSSSPHAAVEEILGTLPRPGVTGVRLKDTRTGALRTFDTGGVFIAIGHQPNSALFKGILDMDANGYLLTLDSISTACSGRIRRADDGTGRRRGARRRHPRSLRRPMPRGDGLAAVLRTRAPRLPLLPAFAGGNRGASSLTPATLSTGVSARTAPRSMAAMQPVPAR